MRALLTAHEADELTDWTKASRSGAAGHCVEVATYNDGVAFRNSNDPEAGALAFTGPEFAAFVDGVKKGEFDPFL